MYMHGVAWHGMHRTDEYEPISFELYIEYKYMCSTLHIVAIESLDGRFCFQSRKSCFCTNTHTYKTNHRMSREFVHTYFVYACIAHTQPQPHWWWLASVWVNGASFIWLIHFKHHFLSIAGHSERDKQQMVERRACYAVRTHCNSSFHFRKYPCRLHNVSNENVLLQQLLFLNTHTCTIRLADISFGQRTYEAGTSLECETEEQSE